MTARRSVAERQRSCKSCAATGRAPLHRLERNPFHRKAARARGRVHTTCFVRRRTHPVDGMTTIPAVSTASLPEPVRRRDFLPFAPPLIGEEEIAEVVDTLRSSWITTGPKTKRFEQEFAAYVGATGALALNSCTAGLHTALVTLGIGPGAEVITTPTTFAASVNVIEHVGARPVLVDVGPDTLNIDAALVAAAITPRTRAILPGHYARHPADLDRIGELAAAHRLAGIEGAAHAVAAKPRGPLIRAGRKPPPFRGCAIHNPRPARG